MSFYTNLETLRITKTLFFIERNVFLWLNRIESCKKKINSCFIKNVGIGYKYLIRVGSLGIGTKIDQR